MTAQIIDFESRRPIRVATNECRTHWTIEDERAFAMLRKDYGDRTAAQIVNHGIARRIDQGGDRESELLRQAHDALRLMQRLQSADVR
ncbi:MAG: hypothetical protein ABIS07_17320 [Dokdonella sp.]